MNDDPWKHRSSGMKCKTCMWFVVKDIAPNTRELDAMRTFVISND